MKRSLIFLMTLFFISAAKAGSLKAFCRYFLSTESQKQNFEVIRPVNEIENRIASLSQKNGNTEFGIWYLMDSEGRVIAYSAPFSSLHRSEIEAHKIRSGLDYLKETLGALPEHLKNQITIIAFTHTHGKPYLNLKNGTWSLSPARFSTEDLTLFSYYKRYFDSDPILKDFAFEAFILYQKMGSTIHKKGILVTNE